MTIVDLPESVVSKYKVEAPLLRLDREHYDIPIELARRSVVEETTFQELMGCPWNVWMLTLKAARPDQSKTWVQVWASRSNIVTVERLPQNMFNGDYVVRITLTDEFDHNSDYVLTETQQYGGKQWELELLCGKPPVWADFPSMWNEWVWDRDVQESAVLYLRQRFPQFAEDIGYAARQTQKVNKIRAWRIVAENVGHDIGRDLGKVQGGSWTSVAAMPIRIAQRAGGWIPPRPKPEFQDPNESGRALVAAPTEVDSINFPPVAAPRYEERRAVAM